MGISGLLPFLKNASRPVHIRDFKGQVAAIDAYCFLHKGAFGCAEQLVQGKQTDFYIKYVMKYVNMLLYYDIKPILVFDGRNLPSKLETENKRRKNRKENREKAMQFLKEGRSREAREYFQRSVDITPDMARSVIQACRERNIDCIVAPYEADAQLAYLNRTIADVIITEDSDLTLFGCEQIIFKLVETGDGVLYERKRLNEVFGNLANQFNFEKFRNMCIMSGCDYLPSLPGIGLGKSKTFWSKVSNPDIRAVLPKIPHYLKMPQLSVTAQYINGFDQAVNTFLYQVVFDPLSRKERPLTDYNDDVDPSHLSYCGQMSEPHTAFQLALGNFDLHSMARVGFYDPDKVHPVSNPKYGKPANHKSMWTRGYTKESRPSILQEKSSHSPHLSSENSKQKEIVVRTSFSRYSFEKPSTPSSTNQQQPVRDSNAHAQTDRKRKKEFMTEEEVEDFLVGDSDDLHPVKAKKEVANSSREVAKSPGNWAKSPSEESESSSPPKKKRILGDANLELQNTTVSRYFGDRKLTSQEIKEINLMKSRRTRTDSKTAGAWFSALDKPSPSQNKSVHGLDSESNSSLMSEKKVESVRSRNPFAIRTPVFDGQKDSADQSKTKGSPTNLSDRISEENTSPEEENISPKIKSTSQDFESTEGVTAVQMTAVEITQTAVKMTADECEPSVEESDVTATKPPNCSRLTAIQPTTNRPSKFIGGGRVKTLGLSKKAVSKSGGPSSSSSSTLKQTSILSMFCRAPRKADLQQK